MLDSRANKTRSHEYAYAYTHHTSTTKSASNINAFLNECKPFVRETQRKQRSRYTGWCDDRGRNSEYKVEIKKLRRSNDSTSHLNLSSGWIKEFTISVPRPRHQKVTTPPPLPNYYLLLNRNRCASALILVVEIESERTRRPGFNYTHAWCALPVLARSPLLASHHRRNLFHGDRLTTTSVAAVGAIAKVLIENTLGIFAHKPTTKEHRVYIVQYLLSSAAAFAAPLRCVRACVSPCIITITTHGAPAAGKLRKTGFDPPQNLIRGTVASLPPCCCNSHRCSGKEWAAGEGSGPKKAGKKSLDTCSRCDRNDDVYDHGSTRTTRLYIINQTYCNPIRQNKICNDNIIHIHTYAHTYIYR